MEYPSFKGKKVLIMGLGLLGRGLGDARFFAEEGAEVLVTDLKTEEQLKDSLEQLKGFPSIRYRLGGHQLEDFKGQDMVIKAAGVPLDSPYIEEARKNGIPIEMDASLLAKLAKGVIFIGITGTRGKTTTTALIYQIAQRAFGKSAQKVFLGGNIRGTATLPLIRQLKAGDIVVLELDSWQLQGFGEAKISPHIAVFTNLLNDHLNYYKNSVERYLEDKAQIFLHQKQNDYLVAGKKVAHLLTAKYFSAIQNPMCVGHAEAVPQDWDIKLKGLHNRENIALAIQAAKILGVDYEVIKEVVEGFAGVEGRLQFLKNHKGISIYNDTTATTPDATIAGLKALSKDKNVVLIMGGADKTLDMSELMKFIPLAAKSVFVLPGTGTEKNKAAIQDLEKNGVPVTFSASLKDAFDAAISASRPGDVLLFSPAFASFGLFKNEYDRGDQFAALATAL